MSDNKAKLTDFPAEERTDLVLAVLSGELTLVEAADRCGATVEEVALWRDVYLAAGRRHRLQSRALGRRAAAERKIWSRTGVRVALGALAVAALLLVGNNVTAAYYPGCVTDLACFSANTPARASDVNDNFAKVVDWIEQKLGPVGSANVVFGGTVGDSTGTAIALYPGARITGVGRVVGDDGLVLRGASGNDDDLTVGADGMVTIPDLTVTNSLAIPGGLPITVESHESRTFVPGTLPLDLGAADGKRVCFLTEVHHDFFDSPAVLPHNFHCRTRISGGQWQLYGVNAIASDGLTCAARCISW
jgi:hypothetical protein